MELPQSLVKAFVSATNDKESKNTKGTTVYGTARVVGDKTFVQIDGSDTLAPVVQAMGANDGDRVTVLIKDHTAIITGNLTEPAVDNTDQIEETKRDVEVKFEVLDDRITSEVATLDGTISTKIEQTEEHIQSVAQSVNEVEEEFQTQITQTSNEISLVASRISVVEGTQTSLQSQITQNANNISMKVSAGDVVSAINMSSEAIKLKTGRLIIESGNFQLNSLGYMKCSGGMIGPFNIDDEKLYNDSGTELWSNSISTEFLETNEVFAKSGGTLCIAGASTSRLELGDYSTNCVVCATLTMDNAVKAPGIKGRTTTAAANVRLQDGSSCYLAYVTDSSERYKHYITDIQNEELLPERLYDLPVRQYIYNLDYLDETDNRFNQYIPGFIAEEMAVHYPIAAEFDEYGIPKNWSERYVIPPMLALIQDQHKRITYLENELAIIKKKMEE